MLVILEGLDKTGKSTVADYFKRVQKCEYVHMSAPAKWHTHQSYMAEMVHFIASTYGKNVVIDRSWYGELVWPMIFGRTPMLNFYDVRRLDEIASQLHDGAFQKIYMHDPDAEAHLARISKFKEPTYDFTMARQLYDQATYEFTKLTFKEAEAQGWT